MKQQRKLFSLKSFLLLFLVTTIFSPSYADNSCPAGMRRTYLDDTTAFAYGSARSFMPALNFYEGNGALWFNRKILIEPRFEVHLVASIEPTSYVESSSEQTLEGFTIVISNAKNTVGKGTGETMGYDGFSKSYVIEFDFNKQTNDPDSSSYSLRYCETNCKSDDRNAIKKGKLSNQRFDKSKTMNWDFRVVYIDQVLSVYSGPNNVLLSYSVDLETKFETYIANIGFTGYMKGNRRELSLSGTFVCEDNFDMSKIDGKFYVKDKTTDTSSYRAGQKVLYLFQFKNNKGQVIPHCYKSGIWTYDFSLVVDCPASNYQVSVKDDYSLFLSMDACSVIGKHSIAIKEASHGDGPVKYYTIESGDIKKISLIGHDGKIGTIPTEIDSSNQAKILKYGPLNGDFSLTDSLTFVLDFSIQDDFGNPVNVGETSDEMLETSQLGLANSNGARVSMAKKDKNYQLFITVVNTGTYLIKKNEFMTDSYELIVRAGGVDPRNSYCTLEGFTAPPTIQQGDPITYSCYFKDSSGNAISASDFESMSDYEFSCGVDKRSPIPGSYTASVAKKNNVLTCTYTASSMGDYSFSGYLAKKGSSTKTELPAKINNFSVMPSFTGLSLIGANIYNPNTRIWYPIDDFSFVYKTDDSGFLTAIDLTDSDHTTLISTFGKFPSDFKFSNFVAVLGSPHDPQYQVELVAKKVELNKKEYVGIYTKNGATDNTVKKSSFDYNLRFLWDKNDKTVTMKYKFAKPVTIGSYTTCFHDLDPKTTAINFDTVSLSNNNKESFLGTMDLKTVDGYLYNYDVGVNNIQVKLVPPSDGVKFRVQANVVLGTYNVYGQASQTFSGTLYFYVNGVECDKKVKAKAGNGKACTLRFQDPELFTFQYEAGYNYHYEADSGAYVDGFLDFHFLLYDVDGFQLLQTDINACGIEIYGYPWGTDETKYICPYDFVRQSFNFKYLYLQYHTDLYYVFHPFACNNKYIVHFQQKSGGTVAMLYSYYTILQPKIHVGETAYVEVTLKDSNNILLGKTQNALESARKGIIVYGTKDDIKYDFEFDTVTSAYTIRYKRPFDIEGVYTVLATFNSQDLKTSNKYLQVILEKISLANSQMFIILDSTIMMSTQKTQTIQNTIQIPRYRLDLYNSDNEKITTYDQSVDVTCVMTHTNSLGKTEKYDLLVDKQDSYINFVHDDDTKKIYPKLVTGFYDLIVTVGKESKKYKLYLVGEEGSEDASNDEEFDPSKTEFNIVEIWGEAGVTYSVSLTFKTADGLRWNYPGDLYKFTYENSYGLDEKRLTTVAQKGAKNGQFIVNINQKEATTNKPGNLLTIYYDGKRLASQVSINMRNSNLFKLVYESGCRDGTVLDLPVLRFIPQDRYGNLYTDLFNTTKTDQATIDRLTRGKSIDNVVLGTHNWLSGKQYLNVQYQTKVATTIQVTSDYFDETYSYRIRSGPIDPEQTYAELKTAGKVTAGSVHDLMIYPRDEYGNVVDNLTDKELKKFIVWYEVLGKPDKHDFSEKCKLVEGYTSSIEVVESDERALVEADEKSYNSILCSTPVDEVGNIEFYVNYINNHEYAGSTFIMEDEESTQQSQSGVGTKGKFFIRLDGTIPTELQHHSSSLYGDAIVYDKVIKNATFTHSVTGEGVNFNLNKLPTDSEIEYSLKRYTTKYDSKTQYVLWYVIKLEGDGWHIDGVLLQKAKVNLAYDANCPLGIWSNMPDGRQYSKGTKAKVSTIVPTRSDGEFKEWNTEKDGSGKAYASGADILMDQTYTLYAQWVTIDPVECRSCLIALRTSSIDFGNLQTVYTKTNTKMKTTVKTVVDSSTLPVFEVTFFDQFNNAITDPGTVADLDLQAALGGGDVKLCVSNSGYKKLINVCPPSNGDDNYNKWHYLTNGDKYSLKLTGPKTITYPLEITGGDNDGSSDPVDLDSAYLNPTQFILTAGEEGTVFMELRTADKKRKNYWYPNLDDYIKVNFAEDKDTCKYALSKGEKPGQYYIKFSCTKKNNHNSFAVTVEGKELKQKVSLVINPGKSYYLEATKPELFDISGNKFTFKTKPVNGETVTFQFKLLDKYKNYLDYTFEDTGTGVKSDLFGTSKTLYSVKYDPDSYLFTDKIDKYLEKHSWEIHCLESGNKYYFIYGKVPGPVDPMKSDFWIDKTEYYVKETSTVEVVLRDSYGINVGIVPGRLDKEKEFVAVQATGSNQQLVYKFDSISAQNTLIYKYQFQNVGEYDVTATYDKKKIANKSIPIVVKYQEVAPNKSQLFISSTQEKLMLTTTKTIINNLEEYPFYKFFFYTPEGEKILNYDKSIPITCQMKKDSYTWDLVVTKEDGYVKFSYKDNFREEFKRLPRGDYSLLVTVDKTPLDYPLFLLGEKGSEDASPSASFDPYKVFVSPARIDGIAGEQYRIDIEFRAADGLRWNYEVQLNSLTVANSYGLSTKYLVLDKKLGEKKGQAVIYLIQYKATTGKPDNILTLTYDGKTLSQKVAVAMKCNKLAKLVYDSGLRNGTVLDLPTLKFIPYDAYNNLYTDLFDPKIYDEKALQNLTVGKSRDGYPLTSNNTVSDNKFLNVQYGSTKPTTIDVTSPYFPETYTYSLLSGPMDPDKTYAELLPSDNKTAGSLQTIVIYPKDEYGNDIDDLDDDEVDKYVVTYEEVGSPKKHDISDTCKLDGKTIRCTSPIEQAGEIQFRVDYVDDPVRCKDCVLTLDPGLVDFAKTTAVYLNTGKQMSTKEKTQVQVAVTPTFELTYHDKFNNVITDPAVTKKIDTKPYFLDTDINLCIADKDYHKHVTVCNTDDGENVNKWYYLVNGDNYFLQLTRKSEDLKFPIEIVGGAKDGSSAPIDKNKTNISPTYLELKAGEEDKVVLELRTPDNKRRNYWFLKPEDHIKASFEKDKDTCSYRLNQGELAGQYYIYFKCTKKIDKNLVTVTVDDEEVPQKVTLKVIPNDPAKALLYYMNDTLIKQEAIGTCSVEDQFKIKEVLFDQYDNRITEIKFSTSLLGITFEPNVQKRPDSVYSATPAIQANGEIVITMKSTLAGQHVLKGNYFPLEKYTILFTHGKPSAENSLLVVEKPKIMAGDTDKVFIHPYDKYNNKIDAMEFKDESPYTVNYSQEGVNGRIAITFYEIQNVDGDNVLAYSTVFTRAGTDTAYGYIGTDQCKCVSCIIYVSAADVDFMKNDYKRFESSTNDFQNIKNGTVEKNTKEDPIYRVYPKDSYGNTIEFIPEEKLKTYTCHLKSQKEGIEYWFKLNNEDYANQPYAEFVKDDKPGGVAYNTLVGGLYYLIFEDKDNREVFEIVLEGSSGDSDASNKDPDPQNTHLNSFNLKYIAGQKGDMYVELRTEDNLRRNSWDGYNITVESCNKDDKTFKFTTEKAGTLGVFYIEVTTEKANTYPKLVECPLTLKVNGEEVKNLHPLMEVSPADIWSTEILPKYYKDGKSNKVLLDGTADSNYVFEVKSFDKYGNLCPTVQEIVGIKVLLLGDEVKSTSADVPDTEFRKYTVTTTVAGVYTVTSAMNPAKGGSYLPNDSIFNIYPGELFRTVINAVTDQIKAGEKPAVYIQCYDKNDNEIPAKDFKDKFDVEFYDPKNAVHDAESSLDKTNDKKSLYTSKTPVTVVGYVTCGAVYNVKNEKVDTTHIKILVVPGDPDPSKSLLSREVSKGKFEVYHNGDNFTVDVNELLILNVTLYDTYGNRIYDIPANASVLDPTMSGNEMLPIKFDVTKNPDYFNLDYVNNQTYIDTFSRLVDGTYDLTYEVQTVLGKAPFKYGIIVEGVDSTHGNGEICSVVLYPDNVTFYAGDTYSLTLELRTCNGLLYNRDINTSDVAVTQLAKDKTFNYSVYKAGNEMGVYNLDIYSEKKGRYNLTAVVNDGKKKHDAGPVYYRVKPGRIPDPRYTVILSKPEPQISADDTIEIQFLLADKFDNQFEERDDIIENQYLYVTNNENIVKNSTKKISEVENGNKFTVTLPPIYPPRVMHINTIYNDGNNSVVCFPEDVVTEIIATIDPTLTKVTSRNAKRIMVGDILDMQLYIYDHNGICLDNDDYSSMYRIDVDGPLENAEKQEKKTYYVRRVEDPTLECQNKYEIITTPADKYTKTGTYNIKVTGGDSPVATFTQICYSVAYSINGFLLKYVDPNFDPDHIPITDTIRFIVSGSDEYGNEFTDPLIDDMTMDLTLDGKQSNFDHDKVEAVSGQLQFNVNIHTVGSHQLHLYFKGEEVLTVNWGEPLPIFTVLTGPCRAENNDNFDLTPLDDAEINKQAHFTFKCYDIFGNPITHGGENFTSFGSLIVSEVQTPIDTTVIDNDDGTYTVQFLPPLAGKYVIKLVVDDNEKYGDDVEFELKKAKCEGAEPFMCPNQKKCVNDRIKCIIPENDCPPEKPFECTVNGVMTCVKSMNECDCPPGFYKCTDFMTYCVPQDRPDMCPFFLPSLKLCKRIDTRYTMFVDGVCRFEDSPGPSMPVCPLGKVLCADLSCRDNYNDCYVSPYCKSTEVRCADQTCTTSAKLCPSIITCSGEGQVACPDGTCADNEAYCDAVPECSSEEAPYLCRNLQCAQQEPFCPKNVACGDGKVLCEDNICREECK